MYEICISLVVIAVGVLAIAFRRTYAAGRRISSGGSRLASEHEFILERNREPDWWQPPSVPPDIYSKGGTS